MSLDETLEFVAGIHGMGRDAAEKIVSVLGAMPDGDERYAYCVRASQLFKEVS